MTDPKIGLFYGSSTSNTEYVAYELQEMLNTLHPDLVDVYNIGLVTSEQVLNYPYLIFGIPTWDIGEVQDDWAVFWPKLEKMNLSGKTIAIFGLGDQYGYADTFQDAMGILGEEVLVRGAKLVGYTTLDGYEFADSIALSIEGDAFMGLSLDEDNQSDLTQERLKKWSAQILREFGLAQPALS